MDHPSADTPGDASVQVAPGVPVASDALRFTYAGSRGPGGQNVNKRATRAELRVSLAALPLHDDASRRLAGLLGRRLTDAGEILITSGEHRSQGQNRAECLDRLRDLVVRAMVRPRPRRKTRPSRGAVERRLEGKRRRSDVKRARGKADD
jgi:ribosome-associated protein